MKATQSKSLNLTQAPLDRLANNTVSRHSSKFSQETSPRINIYIGSMLKYRFNQC